MNVLFKEVKKLVLVTIVISRDRRPNLALYLSEETEFIRLKSLSIKKEIEDEKNTGLSVR